MKWSSLPLDVKNEKEKWLRCGGRGSIAMRTKPLLDQSAGSIRVFTDATRAHYKNYGRQYGSRSLHIALLQCIFNFKAYLIKRFSLNSLAPKSKFEKGEFCVNLEKLPKHK